MSITRPEDFVLTEELAARLAAWENFPQTAVISGGGFSTLTVGSVKRKFEELLVASSDISATIDKPKKSVPLAFYPEELPGGSPNSSIPLLIRASMANFDVHRILVDEGSSYDIMYTSLFKVLGLEREHLSPYVGSDLQSFNGSTSKPWGYVDLIVTFGQGRTAKSIKVKFLVIDCDSLYQCIIGRTSLADLMAVPSTIHLKMKYYTREGTVATLHGDIAAARRCFEAASRGHTTISKVSTKGNASEKKVDDTKPPPSTISMVDLDSRFSKKENKEEKKLRKDKEEDKEASKKIFRPIPDGDFELISLGEDSSRGVKIGADLPALVRKQLKTCLRENADLFAWSASEMPGLDPDVACHQLAIDPTARAVVQRRRKQSPEKAEAAEKAVKDLIEANFMSDAKYSTWLSNVVLVKKSNGKWRMCVDYTDFNRACPKDAYLLPSIDKPVDNSSGFKLLSFMDAYSGYNQIPMAEADKQKTAFMTESGNYYYNVMPFGLKNAGATYQRMMNKVFRTKIGCPRARHSGEETKTVLPRPHHYSPN
ncbi:retrotransposon-related protein [Trifolium pratense]|uniref:Retrotransposon-related protein n=1 Tax=Trifolium pratense TaxID=57577 RepID=A0A2K3N5C0_TRIPR|nr:retrotransposon-related protein [Trifolium pratense]